LESWDKHGETQDRNYKSFESKTFLNKPSGIGEIEIFNHHQQHSLMPLIDPLDTDASPVPVVAAFKEFLPEKIS